MATSWQDRPSNASLFDERQVPPAPAGHVWMEWVGEASAMDSPVVRFNMITGRYTQEQMDMIRALAQVRIARVKGHTRTIRRGNGEGQIPTLGVEVVRFGPDPFARPGQPGSFLQAIPFKAADAVKASECGHEFLIWRERDGEQQSNLRLPNGTVQVVRAETFNNLTDYQRAWR